MSTSRRATGLLFLAAASVYSLSAVAAGPARPAIPAGGAKPSTVQVIDDAASVTPIEPATPASEGTASVSVTEAGTFTIDVSDADLAKVLRMLSLQSQKNIVASKDVRGKVTASLHEVTIREAMDVILRANGYAYREKGNFIFVYTAKEMAEIEKSERQMDTATFRLYYTPAANAVNMVKPVLSAEGQVSFTAPAQTGIGSESKDAGGNTHAVEDVLVVRDYKDNLDRVRGILKEVDRRPQQILVEAVIVRAALTDDNALGMDFTVMGGVDFSTLSAAGSSTGNALSGGIINNSTAGGVVDNGLSGASTGLTKDIPANGLRVGFIKNNVAVFLQALEETTHTEVLANPKILALNKQRGEVIVGKKTGYRTTTVTESTTVESVEFLETGTRLIFRPFIGDDGYIRMEVHPEDSDGGLVNNLPVKSTTEITSNVMIKDGHTIVIGGLFRESSDIGRGQVPGLGDIPGVGNLFKRQRDRTTREEIIILLTPHIVKDDAAYAASSEGAMRDFEKLRVGVRRGMMCFGRERLAETCYDRAVAEMAKPNPNRRTALWHLDCATNLNPLFLEAIDLKRSLTGRELSAVDNCSARTFVKRQILAEKVSAPAPALAPASRPISQQPATQPVADAFAACDEFMNESTTSLLESESEKPLAEVIEVAAPSTAPSTAPSLTAADEPDTAVTELPMAEVGVSDK